MADQHDFDIANATHAALRADLNAALLAAVKKSNGATQPATRHAYQDWGDTTAGTLKRRNAANNAWLTRDTLAETFVLSRSSNTILAETDFGRTIIATSSFTQTFTAAATLGDGWYCHYRNNGTGVITLDPNSTEQIDGATTLALQSGESCVIWCNGSAFFTIGLRRITLAGVQASTSGTAINFTGIPAGVKRVTVLLSQVSTNTGTTDEPIIQIGPVGGIETTGYSGGCWDLAAGQSGATTSGIQIADLISAGDQMNGVITLSLVDPATNIWIATGGIQESQFNFVTCRKALAGVLERVRLTTIGGTNTFDNGLVNISYEF